MKENVIDVLMFLFDNYLSYEEGMPEDETALACELEEAGFETSEINKAFDWLGELSQIKNNEGSRSASTNAMRVYHPQEQEKLDVACRSFMMNLEKMGLLDTPTREIIIDRAMAIEADTLTLQQFKRVVGLVLLNSNQHEEILAWIEDLISDEKGVIH